MQPTKLTFWIACFLFAGWFSNPIFGQSDCSETLRQAQRLYDDGHPQEAVRSLNPCLESGFTKEEKVLALRLITIVQLLENDPKADKTFKDLLRLNPEFQVDTSFNADPAELVYLYEEFRTNPKFYLEAQVGLNRTTVRELKLYSIENVNASGKDYSQGFSFVAGVNIGIPILHRNFRLNTGINFAQFTYSLEDTLGLYGGILPADAPTGTSSPTYFRLSLNETVQAIQVPLLLSLDFDKFSDYNFDRRGIVPYVYAGAGYMLVLGSSYPEISRESGIGSFQSSSEFDNLLEQRSGSNFTFTAGAGLKFKISDNYLTLDFRYDRWLRNIVDPDAPLRQYRGQSKTDLFLWSRRQRYYPGCLIGFFGI